jgi:peptide alpha-N-acetyltransferase
LQKVETTMSHIPKHRQLPDKEAKLFKELLVSRGGFSELAQLPVYLRLMWMLQTQYELKGYKKGLKAADQILKKFPNHGGELGCLGLPPVMELALVVTSCPLLIR